MLWRTRPKAGSGPDSRRWAGQPLPVRLIEVATVLERRRAPSELGGVG